jgi:dipeptidyl aminopeptidase/acylaminoacyl peptidase
MKKITLSVVIVILVIAVAYVGVSYYFSSQLLYPHLMTEEELKAEYGPTTPVEVKLDPEAVTFPSRDPGITLSGWWIEVPNSTRAFILVHGRGTNKKATVSYAPLFVDRGISVLMMDMRGHGESAPAFSTFGDKERNDVLGALDFLGEHGYGPEDNIGCFALSMGATAAYLAAMEDGKTDPSSLDVLVFDSGIADVPNSIRVNSEKVVGAATPFLLPGALVAARLRSGANYADGNPIAHAADLSVPVLFIMCTADEVVPYDDQKRLEEAYAGPKESLVFEGLGHHRGFREKRSEFERGLSAFLSAHGF